MQKACRARKPFAPAHLPAEVLLCFQQLLATAETQKMSLIHIKGNDLLKKLVQGLVGMRNNQSPLVGEVSIDICNDLHSHVRLARARRTNDQSEAGLHTRANGLHLWDEKDGKRGTELGRAPEENRHKYENANIYIHTYIHTYTHTHTQIQKHPPTHTYIHTYIHTLDQK